VSDRIIFMRHGQTADNVQNRLSAAFPGAELSTTGIDQARALAELLSKREIAAIYTSPLRRAEQTAAIIARGRRLPIIIDYRLREMSCGGYEGRNDPEVYQHLDSVWRSWTEASDLAVKAGPGGESAWQILERSTSALTRIRHDYPTGTVLVVTHSGVISLLVPRISINLDPGFGYAEWVGNCELIEIESFHDYYKCVSWGSRIVPDASAQ
jgi:broad specificity phosphatase PhoE